MAKLGVLVVLVVIVVLGLCGGVEGWYLPGVAPREYEPHEVVELKVNKMTSVHTQLPYGYYSLPYCAPDSIIDARENLGEHLAGDIIENSNYEVRFFKIFKHILKFKNHRFFFLMTTF